MIYEWYTGSDSSKTVPRRLNDLRQRGEATSLKEKNKILRKLLELEEEPNWRGYLLWRIGREHADDHCQKEAVAAFFEAKSEFDPLRGTIADVMHAYCDTLEFLICWHYFDRGEMESVAELSVAIVANMKDADFDEFTTKMTFFYLGKALSALARKHDLQWPQPLALASFLKWHHLAPEDEASLEHLVYAYFKADDLTHCRSAVEMCLEVAPAGEVRDRVEEFAREHARELHPASGAS